MAELRIVDSCGILFQGKVYNDPRLREKAGQQVLVDPNESSILVYSEQGLFLCQAFPVTLNITYPYIGQSKSIGNLFKKAVKKYKPQEDTIVLPLIRPVLDPAEIELIECTVKGYFEKIRDGKTPNNLLLPGIPYIYTELKEWLTSHVEYARLQQQYPLFKDEAVSPEGKSI